MPVKTPQSKRPTARELAARFPLKPYRVYVEYTPLTLADGHLNCQTFRVLARSDKLAIEAALEVAPMTVTKAKAVESEDPEDIAWAERENARETNRT